jgi:hypothetical protein
MAEVESRPDISTMLKQAKGGLTQTLRALRFSTEPEVQRFLEKYDSVPVGDRKSLPWEAICIAAGVDPTTLLGAAILALQAASRNAVKIIALTHHPEVMAASVNFAQLAGGDKDRAAVHTGLGFLASPKGSTFIINPVQRKELEEGDEDGEDEPDLEHLFPDLAKTQEALIPPRARLLDSNR